MTSVKVPVLISKYAQDLFMARVINGPGGESCGRTSSEAFDSMRNYLKKLGSSEPDLIWPNIDRYELHRTSVSVRLYYRDGKRQFPASREVKMPVRYTLGHYVDGSVECFLVDYGIDFYCPAIRELQQLIEEAVRGAAAHLASQQLAGATPPIESELREVRVRLHDRKRKIETAEFEALSVVADPVVRRARCEKRTLTKHRGEESSRLLKVMQESSVLLVGPAGCGKSTVIRSTAAAYEIEKRLQAKELGKPTPGPILWISSAENLIAGMQYLGEWEARLEKVIDELESINGILVIESLIDLVRLGGTQPTDSLASFLMPYVRRGEVRLVIETNADELDAARRLLPGWAECFQTLPIELLSVEQTSDLAETMLQNAAKNDRLEVDATAAETATRLFSQFMPYQPPPRGVVELISDVMETAKKSGAITTTDNVDRFTHRTGLPRAILLDTIPLRAEEVRSALGGSVIGQNVAVEAVANVVLRLKAGLCDPRRPVGVMLFSGPTGVGKTQLAKSLSDYLFGSAGVGSKSPLVRLDMSEYGGWDAVDRFLIATDGEVAPWLARVRAKPMSVILLDEFEKSSPEVHDCLLSALDEGRISDRFGRTTTLCGSIVIMTSNVGSRSTAPVGFAGKDHGAVRREIEQTFRPEFLNRLDEIVSFDPLPPEIIEKIVEKELASLARRESLESRRVKLIWSEQTVKRLAAIGFDPLLGARPLQRAIEREVTAKIARHLLSITSGSKSVAIDLDELVS